MRSERLRDRSAPERSASQPHAAVLARPAVTERRHVAPENLAPDPRRWAVSRRASRPPGVERDIAAATAGWPGGKGVKGGRMES